MYISQLAIYPVKSCGAVYLKSVFLENSGFRGDREYMVVDRSGRFLTQRQYPKLATVLPQIIEDKLVLHAHGVESIPVFADLTGNIVEVEVWKARVLALDMGDQVASWFSDLLGVEGLRLVKFTKDSKRNDKRDAIDSPVRFQDGSQLLVVCQESLDAMNQILDLEGGPISMARFRPNIVIAETDAWEEDRWEGLNSRGLLLRRVDHCFRCEITTTHQQTGMRTGKEPLQFLGRSHRLARKTESGYGAAFGVYFNVKWGSGETIFVNSGVTPILED